MRIFGVGRNGIFGAVVNFSLLSLLLSFKIAPAFGQSPPPERSERTTLQGQVRDSSGKPLANAAVFLQPSTATSSSQIAHTDLEGSYRFAAISDGTYTLRAEMAGYDDAVSAAVSIAAQETRKIDLVLASHASGKAAAQTPQFFDEPQFTVAGVTAATGSGGHGSDTVVRATEALARATVSLSKDNGDKNSRAGSDTTSAAEASSLRDAVARNPSDSALHHRLGEVEDRLGNPLEAVREYQRAAELDASEGYLFDWGTELLTHRALEPAAEVFAHGNKLFPKSVRMLVALGVTWYARGSYDHAAECLDRASDLAPDDPAPYLFLGRMQSVEKDQPNGSAEKFARFAERHPNNALANYYLAVSLSKQSTMATAETKADSQQAESLSHEESLLLKAVHIDPNLGAAYLQLGILYTQRTNFARAISAFQKAIEVTSAVNSKGSVVRPDGMTVDEIADVATVAHFRLAQTYLRIGEKDKAQEELQLHTALVQKRKEDTEHKRRKIQEFVISMRNQDSTRH